MYGNSVIKITLVTITKFTSSDMAQFRNAIAQVTATTTYMKLGVIAVSYTHLDVYKRQLMRCSSGTMVATSCCRPVSGAQAEEVVF